MTRTPAEKRDWLKGVRLAWVDESVTQYRKRIAKRIAASRGLLGAFGERLFLADLHTHSCYSDGASFVHQNAEWAKLAGLDFIFATDHGQIKARRCVGQLRNASWGQESGAQVYHIGLLEPPRAHTYRSGQSLASAWDRIKTLTRFQWVAHPIWQEEPVTEKQYRQVLSDLSGLGDLAFEMLNGCGEIGRAHHLTGRAGSRLADDLLGRGQKVTLVGASDSHRMVEIGTAWTGIYAERCTASALIDALSAGRCFASEAPLVDVSCNGKPMGSTLRPRPGAELRLRCRVVDSAGVSWVRVISNGKVIKEIWSRHQPLVEVALDRQAPRAATTFRIEAAASDDRRVFSTPIYIRP